jgi:putative FmdB family regulatory protein
MDKKTFIITGLMYFSRVNMPIYAYRCNDCGFAKDVLQKMSDPVLTDCPSCGKAEFKKQVTAAGFQLKGSGWYATDFKGGSGGASATAASGEGKKQESDTSSAPAAASTDSGSTASPVKTGTTDK